MKELTDVEALTICADAYKPVYYLACGPLFSVGDRKYAVESAQNKLIAYSRAQNHFMGGVGMFYEGTIHFDRLSAEIRSDFHALAQRILEAKVKEAASPNLLSQVQDGTTMVVDIALG